MCGIVGWLDYEGFNHIRTLKQMNKEVSHRGPDFSGLWYDEIIGLGHSRLAIIDTSSRSNQPMISDNNRFVLVYNGEIYNFKELSHKLIERGQKFKTLSDTEVVLNCFKYWGINAVTKFNGMFAFAVWDKISKTLYMARDRVGEKPLYYKFENEKLIFCSEILPLTSRLRKSDFEVENLAEYMQYNYVSDSKTIFNDIYQIPPGHIFIKKKKQPVIIKPYWNLINSFHKKNESTEEKIINQLNDHKNNSIQSRMVSDVPIGVFLSGGIDSASVTATMLESSSDVNIITAKFAENTYNEFNDAQATAKYLNATTKEVFIRDNSEDIIKAINCSAKHFLADNSAIPFWLISREAKKKIKVALTGDGADELFAGYETYIADKIAQKYLKFISPNLWNYILQICHKILPTNFNKLSFSFKLLQFIKGMCQKWPTRHFAWRQIFSFTEIKNLLNDNQLLKDEYTKKNKFICNNLDLLDSCLMADINTWLTDCLLIKSDRMSMAHGLEVRSPFLDHTLIEFASSIPSNLKLKYYQKKYIFKKSLRTKLSSEILARQKKGFNSPVNHWLKTSIKDYARDMLFSNTTLKIFNVDFLESLWNDHQKMKIDNSFKIYNLLILSIWLNKKHKLNLH